MGGYSLGMLSSHQVGHLRVLPGRVDVQVSILMGGGELPCCPGTSSLQHQPGGVSETGHSWVSWGHAWLVPGLPA